MAHRHEEIFARLGLWNEAHGLQVRICDEDFPRAPDIVARRRRIDFVFIGRHGPCECDEAVLAVEDKRRPLRSEEHTSELQSLMRISYAVFCLKKKKYKTTKQQTK